jgi:hypothetical protein
MENTAAIKVIELSPSALSYVDLERQIAAHELQIKPIREQLEEARKALINESGIKVTNQEVFFQDQHGVVHRIVERKYVTLPVAPFGIEHTRRPEFGEAKGSLSEKAAKEAGFTPVINKTQGGQNGENEQ